MEEVLSNLGLLCSKSKKPFPSRCIADKNYVESKLSGQDEKDENLPEHLLRGCDRRTSTTSYDHDPLKSKSESNEDPGVRVWRVSESSWFYLAERHSVPAPLRFTKEEIEEFWTAYCPKERQTITAYGKQMQLGRGIRVFYWLPDAGVSTGETTRSGTGERHASRAEKNDNFPGGSSLFSLRIGGNRVEPRDLPEGGRRIKMLAYNCALVNFYDSGVDSIGWHSDRSTGLRTEVPIVTVSLGPGEREFSWKPAKRAASSKIPRTVQMTRERSPRRADQSFSSDYNGSWSTKTCEEPLQSCCTVVDHVTENDLQQKGTVLLRDGSVSVMGGLFQEEALHCIPKRKGVTECRISITLRSQMMAHDSKIAYK
ncbi:unnamed protein product [Amoebophrya sp. A25]|nr:unnamed protein product [Amoebophrya sp. A25]|eukprot:GSA25T00025976001.1